MAVPQRVLKERPSREEFSSTLVCMLAYRKQLRIKAWYQNEIDDIRANSTGDDYIRRNAERGMDNTIAMFGGPKNYEHYCQMMEEASANGVLPSVFLRDYYQVLYDNLHRIVPERMRRMFEKHRENVEQFFELFNACSKPEEWRELLFSRHWELSIAEMTTYHLEDCQRLHNNVGRILERTEKVIAELEAQGL